MGEVGSFRAKGLRLEPSSRGRRAALWEVHGKKYRDTLARRKKSQVFENRKITQYYDCSTSPVLGVSNGLVEIRPSLVEIRGRSRLVLWGQFRSRQDWMEGDAE